MWLNHGRIKEIGDTDVVAVTVDDDPSAQGVASSGGADAEMS